MNCVICPMKCELNVNTDDIILNNLKNILPNNIKDKSKFSKRDKAYNIVRLYLDKYNVNMI